MRMTRWHILCPVAEGEFRAREILHSLLGTVGPIKNEGSFATWWRQWCTQAMDRYAKRAPADPERKRMWDTGAKTPLARHRIIENAFLHFDLDQIRPVDVSTFLDQWEGRSAAFDYRNLLSQFFEKCCRKGLIDSNPAREVELEKPPKRNVFITHEQYLAIRKALLTGSDGRPTRTGEMVQCYMDLLYLLYQRGTEIRLLKWDQVGPDGIEFTPTKTEKSSGKSVLVPLGQDAKDVLAKAKRIGKQHSAYVIQTEHGRPYTANGIRTLFRRACKRIGIKGLTLRDIRAKAATDATTGGYDEAQLQVALAHTDGAMTRRYIKKRQVSVSEVVLTLP